MALKAFIKDLSEIEESQQALYKATDGGHVLDVESVDGFDLQNVSALKNSLGKIKGDYEQAKATLKSFGELDPKEALRKLERYDQIKDLNPDRMKKELANDVRTDIENEYKSKIEKSNALVETMKASVRKAAMSEVNAAIAEAGANPRFLEGYISKVADVDFNDDGYKLIFKGENGTERFKMDNEGNTIPFTSKDLVNELKNHEDYGQIFPSDSKSGAGGEKTYNSKGVGIKTVPRSEARNHVEGIANGTVQVRD